jgi:hypothetical protein
MTSFNEAPDQLAPSPTGPNDGLIHVQTTARIERPGLFPRVHLVPGDSLFKRPVRRGSYSFDEIVIVLKEQDVDALLDDAGDPRIEIIETDTFTGVVLEEGGEMWKRTMNTPPDKT